jgi:DNA-binding Lrp family transcriptional regulator
MLRLDETTRETLEELSRHFKQSIAEIIRQLIAQATPEDFPQSCHLAVQECRQRGARRTP